MRALLCLTCLCVLLGLGCDASLAPQPQYIVHQQHPDELTLTQYANGFLFGAQLVEVEDHVAHCDMCREVVEAVDGDQSGKHFR